MVAGDGNATTRPMLEAKAVRVSVHVYTSALKTHNKTSAVPYEDY